ncbi:hypothetical protein HMF7854_08095 [Sphingomonas ginkgonis]|uniref:Alpha 1,4-glycosyltransferase domain-containing protein n=1 Tax=Sphingomonas ginkgonis TaxID=2315330 RepID=A0A3R9YME7_9SPHN|nr:hypothetical protein [Sphingomonas ginkgonis]RST30802.1 hypothetical protein HMF7854_08095 [Sphingomonas ginkgonis]
MKVASFWDGPITALETACLLSFARRGAHVRLYSFEPKSLPAPIEVRDAGEVLDRSYLNRFLTNGKPNVAHFADLFRLVMMKQTDEVWIDCDVLLVRPDLDDWPADLFVREGDSQIINCVLRVSDQTVLDKAIEFTEACLDKDLPWAATQNVIPRAIECQHLEVPISSPAVYSPVQADDWFKLVLPEYRDECERLTSRARTVHLFDNVLQRVGFFKDIAPPAGSYLHARLEEQDLLSLFKAEYPAEVVRNMHDGWKLRFSGEAIGLGALVRQAIPALRRTAARRATR